MVRPVSRRWDAALRGVHRVASEVTCAPPGGGPFAVRVSELQVTADRTSKTLRQVSATLVPGTRLGLDGVTPYGSLLRPWRGVDYGDGQPELMPLGVFRLENVDTEEPGAGISTSGYSLEYVVAQDAFVQPRTEESGSTIDLITLLIRESLPDAVVVNRATRDASVPRVTWEKERWDAIDGTDASLARAIGAWVYCDPTGAFIIRDVPTLKDAPVWTADTGRGGVRVSTRRSSSADGVHNIVVAMGDRTDGTAVGPGIAQDDDPASPTYVGGPFGRRPRFYSSPLITTADQAKTAAEALLAESLGLAKTLSFDAVPNPALEPGDVVLVPLDDGTAERHLIDKITISLATGAMSCDTRATPDRGDDGSST